MTEQNAPLGFQARCLVQQGYQTHTQKQLAQLNWGLRFTPAVCSLITLVAVIYQLPLLLLAVSALGVWAFFAPAAHPMDLLYNHAVRHVFGAVRLPPNPFQRRLACLAAGVMNFAAATFFWLGLPGMAIATGAALLALQAIVIFTHFCALSWIYEILMKALGRWRLPVDVETGRHLLNEGALLVDVRGPDEFDRDHLEGALNLPLEEIQSCAGKLRGRTVLLYCRSGGRSQLAAKQLRKLGFSEVYDLGGLARAQLVVET